MHLIAAEISLLELPLHEPFVASHGTTTTRAITIVRLETDHGPGWGECAALPAATYTKESARGAFEALTQRLVPPLLGSEVGPDQLGGADGTTDHPMAIAAVEMAVLDAKLTSAGRPLSEHLGAATSSVLAGVSIGLGTVEETVATAVDLADQGYGRLKCKIAPGHDLALVTALRQVVPNVELHIDANGAYPPDAVSHLAAVVAAGVDAIEQPFLPDEVDAAAALVAAIDPIPVVADEAVTAPADAIALARRGAATAVSIKPPRVGGLQSATDLLRVCRAEGLAVTVGGMLECGLGRHALTAFAALTDFDLIGDLSPAGRWLAADPWPDLSLVDGRLSVPNEPGVAPPPDHDLLIAHTTTSRRLETG